MVDGVSDVLNIAHEDLESVPDFGIDVESSFLRGIAKSHDRMIMLLCLEEIIRTEAGSVATAC